jgi:hypothetical protein
MRQRLTLNTPTQHPHTTQDDQATPKRDINSSQALTGCLAGKPFDTRRRVSQGRLVTLRIQCLNIDCHDPGTVAGFWEAALGWRRTHDTPEQ